MALSGKEGTVFRGTAICFDDEASFYPALAKGEVKEGSAVILRYQVSQSDPSHTASAC